MQKYIKGLTFFTVATLIIVMAIKYLPLKESKQARYVKAIYSMPVTYDPAQMNDGASLIFSELVYEGLLRFTENFGVQAGIAESWETSEDGTVISFKLNPKSKFHNGDPITSKDVEFSLTRVLAPESKVYKYYDMIKGASEYHKGISSSVAGIKVIDRRRIEIHLKAPFPPILYVLAGGTAKIMPASSNLSEDFFKAPIGAGPFQFEEKNEIDILLKRSPYYHGKKPKLEKLVLRAVDQDSAMTQATKGEIHDLSSWPLSGMENVFEAGQDISAPVADTWIIGFNTRIPPLDKFEIRQALKQSIDNEKFRKTFYPSASPAFGYVPHGFPGHVKKAPSRRSSIVVPEHAPITLSIPYGLKQTEKISEFFLTELKKKGWKINVEILPWDEMMKRYENKSLQTFLVSMIVDYPDTEFLLNNFASDNPDNYSGIRDSKIDRLIAKARLKRDRIERYKLYEELASRVNELALSANLFHSKPHYWVHHCVKNFKPNLLAVAYIDYRSVELTQDCLEDSRSRME